MKMSLRISTLSALHNVFPNEGRYMKMSLRKSGNYELCLRMRALRVTSLVTRLVVTQCLYGVCGNEYSGALNTITAVERGAILCLSKRAQTEWVFAPDNAHKRY